MRGRGFARAHVYANNLAHRLPAWFCLQGLANPAACVSKFIALLCDPSAKIRDAAWAAVNVVRERYPSFVVEHALAGLLQVQRLHFAYFCHRR